MIGELCCGDSIHYRGDRLTPPYSLSHACRVIGCESEMLSMRPSALLLACLNVELIQLPVCPVGTKSFVTVSDVAVRMQTIVDNQNIHDMYFLYSIVPPILGGRDTDTHRVSSFFMVMNGYYCMSDTKVGNISLSCKYSLPKVYIECLSLLFPADIFFSLI